jgi:hypothetical protein
MNNADVVAVRFCGCGCGEEVKVRRYMLFPSYKGTGKFKHGHAVRLQLKSTVGGLKRLEELAKKRFCKCGCSQVIQPRRCWRDTSYKLPSYIRGHNLDSDVAIAVTRGVARSELGKTRRKELEVFRLCACGCGEKLQPKASWYWPGTKLPKYLLGHGATTLLARRRQSERIRKAYALGLRTLSKPRLGSFERGWVRTVKGGRIYCRSSWEKRRCRVLDADKDVILFSACGFRIPYKLRGLYRTYFPDLLVKRKFEGNKLSIEEIKGYFPDKKMWEAKKEAGKEFCRRSGFKFVVLDSLFLVLSKGALPR